MEVHGKDRRVQHDVLYAFGLGDYGFIDYDMEDFLLSIPPDTPDEKARKEITDMLVEKIVEAIDNGRATTGLDLEAMITQQPEIAIRIQEITKLRNEEMENN